LDNGRVIECGDKGVYKKNNKRVRVKEEVLGKIV